MSIITSCRIVLAVAQRKVLTARARRASGEHRDVLRSRLVLAAARGCSNVKIARDLGVDLDTVRKWRHRFAT